MGKAGSAGKPGKTREADGKFVPGHNAPGPGNPRAATVGEYRKALNEAVSAEDVKEIARMLVRKAKAGDLEAAKVILERTCGKVAQSFDHTIEGEIRMAGRPVTDVRDELRARALRIAEQMGTN